jgi:ubiquitin-protein ligase E3 C
MKELLEATVAAGCQPEYGLFAAAEGSNLMYPNPAAEAIPQGLALLEFLGGLQ